jgi:micrococcal nuclease
MQETSRAPTVKSRAALARDLRTKPEHANSLLVFAKVVEVEPVDQDRYGRTVAFVRVKDTLVNEKLIRQGLAWVYNRYCKRPVCEEWRQLEAEAWAARRGLWSMPKPVAPWEFRRGNR